MSAQIRVAVTAAVLTLSLTACDAVVTNPLAASLPNVFPSSAFGCRDATGPNSTPEQIAGAMLDVQQRAAGVYLRAASGAPVDPAQQADFAKAMEGLGDLYVQAGIIDGTQDLNDPEKLRKLIAEEVFNNVPSGGDAAFGAAVCDLPAGWLEFPQTANAALGVTDDVHRIYRTTSHALRHVGRLTCSLIADSDESADAWMDAKYAEDEGYSTALNEPAEYIRTKLEEIDTQLAALDSGDDLYDAPIFGGREAARWSMQKTRDYFARIQSRPQIISRLADAVRRADWAAIEHQCPQLSVRLAGVNKSGEPTLGRADPFQWAEGFGTARPTSFSIASTASSTVSDIAWESWGAPRAIGKGVTYGGVDEPKADIYVIAFDLGPCDGHAAYRKLVRTQNREDFDPDEATDICP